MYTAAENIAEYGPAIIALLRTNDGCVQRCTGNVHEIHLTFANPILPEQTSKPSPLAS